MRSGKNEKLWDDICGMVYKIMFVGRTTRHQKKTAGIKDLRSAGRDDGLVWHNDYHKKLKKKIEMTQEHFSDQKRFYVIYQW